jgi:glycerol uptake facilitator protein
MSPFLAEFIGTAILILLGNGVVANCLLKETNGNQGGWIVITFGWAMAVFVGVFITGSYSGAHLNSAVTLAMALKGQLAWSLVPSYWIAQLLGAMLGSFLVYLSYYKHYQITENSSLIQATFCTSPAIKSPISNLVTETIGTFVLVFGVFYMVASETGLGAISALPVAFLVLSIGLSLGGPTGYAINPVRDLGPRIMHALLPIKHKGSSNWGYAWVPVLGPLLGAALATVLHIALQ